MFSEVGCDGDPDVHVRKSFLDQTVRQGSSLAQFSDKVKYLLKAGQVASASGSHAQARSYANQVLQVETKNGEALILIGNAIAAQGGSCEAPDSWGAYWLAYDYYQRARSLDPSVADKAGDRMGSMSARFPTQQEAFFYQLTDGKSVTVACGGLGETTTVRTRK